jgi:photosystem II cytochrome b559 subunit alpha
MVASYARLIAITDNTDSTVQCDNSVLEAISTGERPFIDILQDRRYWVIHIITIPSLFLAGVIFVLSGFVYKLFGVPNFNQYFYNDNTQISLINDRFSVLNEIEDL